MPKPDRRRRRLMPLVVLCLSLVTMWGLVAPSTTLALSGISSSGSAATAQYVAAAHRSRGVPTDPAQLPFTGYAVLSVLAVGLCLASGGLAVRLRTRRQRS